MLDHNDYRLIGGTILFAASSFAMVCYVGWWPLILATSFVLLLVFAALILFVRTRLKGSASGGVGSESNHAADKLNGSGLNSESEGRE